MSTISALSRLSSSLSLPTQSHSSSQLSSIIVTSPSACFNSSSSAPVGLAIQTVNSSSLPSLTPSSSVSSSSVSSSSSSTFASDLTLAPEPTLLPSVLYGIILSYSGYEEREACYNLGWWQKIAWQGFSWEELGPKVTIFDEQSWAQHVNLEAHGLDFNEARAYDTRRAALAVRDMLTWSGDAGITLLTIPRGLSLYTLEAITKEFSAKKDVIPISITMASAFQAIANETTSNPYKIAITNETVLSFIDQNALENVTILHVATLMITTHMRNQICLDNANIRYTCCMSLAENECPAIGSHTHNNSMSIVIKRHNIKTDAAGFRGSCKF